jgi:hypothetical protein
VSRISIGRPLKRGWMLLIAVAVVAVAGFSVYRLHAIFGSHNTTSSASAFSNEIVPVAVKDERSVNTKNAYAFCLDKS